MVHDEARNGATKFVDVHRLAPLVAVLALLLTACGSSAPSRDSDRVAESGTASPSPIDAEVAGDSDGAGEDDPAATGSDDPAPTPDGTSAPAKTGAPRVTRAPTAAPTQRPPGASGSGAARIVAACSNIEEGGSDNWSGICLVGQEGGITLVGKGTAAEAFGTEPALSRDGRRIAFTKYWSESQPDGGLRNVPEIWTMHADGSNLKLLSRHKDGDDNPDWSPDGSRVAFVRKGHYERCTNRSCGGHREIYSIASSGGEATRLTDTPRSQGYEYDWLRQNVAAAWSPDGSRIAHSSDRGGWQDRQIWTIPAGGGEPNAVTAGDPKSKTDPAWSPDGARLAYSDGRSIWMVNADGSSPKQLTQGGGSCRTEFGDKRDCNTDTSPAWIDDHRIVFHRGNTKVGECHRMGGLMIVDVRTSQGGWFAGCDRKGLSLSAPDSVY